MAELTGADPAFPLRCAECAANPDYLLQNIGVSTQISGFATYGAPASFNQVTYVGITTAAGADAAQFAQLWFEELYRGWLAIEPERKVPLRHTDASGNDLLAEWRALPLSGISEPIDAVFPPVAGAAFSDVLVADLTAGERWGYAAGQGALAAQLYEQLTVAPILQRMLSGYISSSQAILDTDVAVSELLIP